MRLAAWVLLAALADTAGARTPPDARPEIGPPGAPADLEFKAAIDGTVQRYVELLPAGFDPGQEHDLMIALHGHGSDRWQYVRHGRGECQGSRDVAARHGMIFISPDYRASTSWMGPQAEADLAQLIGLLRERHKIGRVILTGGSMGGTSALIFATLHPELIDGVVSLNGTANMVEYGGFSPAIAASYGGTKQQRPEEYRNRSPELAPQRLTMPVAFTVGGKDTTVPPDSVRRLAAALRRAGKQDLLILDRPEAGHSTSYEDTVEATEFVIKAAAEARLQTSGGPPRRRKAAGPNSRSRPLRGKPGPPGRLGE